MYFKIATFLFILNMIFFLRPVILSLVLYKKLTVLGTLKRLFNFLIMIPIEILRIVFLRQIKYYVDPNVFYEGRVNRFANLTADDVDCY